MCDCLLSLRRNSTRTVLDDIAETVHRGLLELGYDSQRSYCASLFSRCLTPLGVEYRKVRYCWSYTLLLSRVCQDVACCLCRSS